MTQHDLAPVLAGLKDFQRASVEHASSRLFGGEGTGRFLVADEVGLGKTLIARGIIARAIEHHIEKGTDRIDVVYICSNGDIARQNIRRLNVIDGHDFSHATRLTLLPRQLHELAGQRLNFVSFTPSTSFSLRSTEGMAEERALLHNMMREVWADRVKWGRTGQRVFAGRAGFDGFRRATENPINRRFDAGLLEALADGLDSSGRGPALVDAYEELHARFRHMRASDARNASHDLRVMRGAFVGELRALLARCCVDALEPDLIIMDEFQRFKHLFDPEDPAGSLAREMFDYPDVAVLLLSATPYRMYTQGGEGEDHYSDFLDTINFLFRRDEARLASVRADLAAFRRALFEVGDGAVDDARAARARIENALRIVMSRTERLAATADRSGMLSEVAAPNSSLTADDVRRFVTFNSVGTAVGSSGALPYWEATPYPLSFMDGYQLTNRFEAAIAERDAAVTGLPLETLSLPMSDVDWYRPVDPGNSRMRSLASDVLDDDMWRMLWLPPSLPYYAHGGAYAADEPVAAKGKPGEPASRQRPPRTKRLVFSAWSVVPTAIASYLTYEAERRMTETSRNGSDSPIAPNSTEGRARVSERLIFTRSKGRLTGMPVLALLYPSLALAEVGDPLALARTLGAYATPPSLDAMHDEVLSRVRELLSDLPRESEGRPDQRWYWAAPFLLDKEIGDDTAGWLRDARTATSLRDGFGSAISDEGSLLDEHLVEAAELLDSNELLGPMPADLADVLATMALAGPGVAAARALSRDGDIESGDEETRRAGGAVAWGLRSLFNDPAVTQMIAGEHDDEATPYWQLVLRYCADGGLQSVLDEWAHVLIDGLQLRSRPNAEVLEELSNAMRTALMGRAVTYRVRRVEREEDGSITLEREQLRAQFSRRFGDGRAETDKGVESAANVRAAFNSPFRPFVLATTSVGQEGLDFHTYCHAVVHWNLPSNPVDMEQREGRVHRYKGHAVRRNLAMTHRAAGIAAHGDPWDAMFHEASSHRAADDDELVPYWVFTADGGPRIERYVPALPLSREANRLMELRKSTASYRLVFGQPRQEDLLQFLETHADGVDLDELRIDLRPPEPSGPRPESLMVDLTPLETGRRPRGVEFFLEDDEGYEAWLSTHDMGFILNVGRWKGADYGALHSKTCRHMTGLVSEDHTWTHGGWAKVVAGYTGHLTSWLMEHRRVEPVLCGTCKPSLSGSAPALPAPDAQRTYTPAEIAALAGGGRTLTTLAVHNGQLRAIRARLSTSPRAPEVISVPDEELARGAVRKLIETADRIPVYVFDVGSGEYRTAAQLRVTSFVGGEIHLVAD